jgi:hypothetical protein
MINKQVKLFVTNASDIKIVIYNLQSMRLHSAIKYDLFIQCFQIRFDYSTTKHLRIVWYNNNINILK